MDEHVEFHFQLPGQYTGFWYFVEDPGNRLMVHGPRPGAFHRLMRRWLLGLEYQPVG